MANFRWRKRQQFQERDIAKQKVLLQRIDTRRQKFIEDYNKKINKETAKMKSNVTRKNWGNSKDYTSNYRVLNYELSCPLYMIIHNCTSFEEIERFNFSSIL